MSLKWPLKPEDMPWGKFVTVDDETGAVEVVDNPKQGQKTDFWICPVFAQFWTWRVFPDSKVGRCTKCERSIIYRASTGAKNGNAPKICLECAQKPL